MNKPILTEKEADQELAEAVGRYDEQRPGLGHDFLDAIDEVLLRVSYFPIGEGVLSEDLLAAARVDPDASGWLWRRADATGCVYR